MPPCLMLKQPNPCHDSDTHPKRISCGLQVALPVRTRYHVRHMNTVATTRVERLIGGIAEDALLFVADAIRSRVFTTVTAEHQKAFGQFPNSTALDLYFRQFNGHTQVNMTDLRNVPFPTEVQLRAIGGQIADAGADQDEVDRIVTKETGSDREAMGRFLGQISWETEVWIACDPDHVVHFNGERFLGPYPDTVNG